MSAIINDAMLKQLMASTKIIALDDNKYASKQLMKQYRAIDCNKSNKSLTSRTIYEVDNSLSSARKKSKCST